MTFAGEVFDAVQDPLVVFDADWRVTWANTALERYSGVKRAVLIGLCLWESLPHLSNTRLALDLRRAMSEREPASFEIAAPFRPGDVLSISLQPAGEGLAVSFRNVTGAIRSETAAQSRLAQLEALYDGAPIGLALLDSELRYVRVNRALAELNGVDAADHIGRTVREVIPEVGGNWEGVFRGVLQTGKPVKDLEVRGETAAAPGIARTWLESVSPVRGPDGAVTQIQVTIAEITEHKAAEARLAAALSELKQTYDRLVAKEAALRRSEESLRAIFEASAEGLTLCRLIRDEAGEPVDYEVLDANAAHERLTGAPRAELLSRRASETVGPYDPRWIEAAKAVVAGGDAQSFEFQNPANGRWLDVRVSPVVDDLFVETLIDMTAGREAQQQREQLLTEMNHRVKNNFQMVASLLDLQARRAGDPEVRDQLHSAMRRIRVLADLHESLAPDPNVDEIEFGGYLEGLCEKLRASITDPSRVRLRYEGQSARLSSSVAVPLGFVVNELVTNALKYAFPDGGRGEVRVVFSPKDDGFQLVVADDGQGLPLDADGQGGGLGMRLVSAFIAQAGATLESCPNEGPCEVQGACYRIQLRAAPEEAIEASEQATHEGPAGSTWP